MPDAAAKLPGGMHVPLTAFDDPVHRAPERDVSFTEHAAWIAASLTGSI